MAHLEFPNSPVNTYRDLNVGGTVVSLDPPFDEVANQVSQRVLVQCQKATARIRIDGQDPTANSGVMLRAGDILELEGERVGAARFIADTNTAAVLSVHYFQS